MKPELLITDIDEEMPEDAETRLDQLGFHVANLVDQIVHTMMYQQQVHPMAVVEPIESKIITMEKPGNAKKVRLVAVMLPIDLAMEIKNTAIKVVNERKEKERAAH